MADLNEVAQSPALGLGKPSSLFLTVLPMITLIFCTGLSLVAILCRCWDIGQWTIAKFSSSERVYLWGRQPATVLVLD